jgi:hypothetical protein
MNYFALLLALLLVIQVAAAPTLPGCLRCFVPWRKVASPTTYSKGTIKLKEKISRLEKESLQLQTQPLVGLSKREVTKKTEKKKALDEKIRNLRSEFNAKVQKHHKKFGVPGVAPGHDVFLSNPQKPEMNEMESGNDDSESEDKQSMLSDGLLKDNHLGTPIKVVHDLTTSRNKIVASVDSDRVVFTVGPNPNLDSTKGKPAVPTASEVQNHKINTVNDLDGRSNNNAISNLSEDENQKSPREGKASIGVQESQSTVDRKDTSNESQTQRNLPGKSAGVANNPPAPIWNKENAQAPVTLPSANATRNSYESKTQSTKNRSNVYEQVAVQNYTRESILKTGNATKTPMPNARASAPGVKRVRFEDSNGAPIVPKGAVNDTQLQTPIGASQASASGSHPVDKLRRNEKHNDANVNPKVEHSSSHSGLPHQNTLQIDQVNHAKTSHQGKVERSTEVNLVPKVEERGVAKVNSVPEMDEPKVAKANGESSPGAGNVSKLVSLIEGKQTPPPRSIANKAQAIPSNGAPQTGSRSGNDSQVAPNGKIPVNSIHRSHWTLRI